MRSLAVVLCVVLATLAGCMGGGAKRLEGPFTVEVPEWEAGFFWDYKDTYSYVSRFQSSGGDNEDGSASESRDPVRHRVLNTTVAVPGQSALYWALEEDPKEPPASLLDLDQLFQITAYSTDNLEPVARVAWYGGTMMPTVNDAEPQPPGFQFPLHDGQTWAPENYEEDFLGGDFVVEARVLGREVLSWGGRSTTVVHVRLTGVPAPGYADEVIEEIREDEELDELDGTFTMAFMGDYYWGIEERNLFQSLHRTTASISLKGTHDDGRAYTASGTYEASVRRQLVDHGLVGGPEVPLPAFYVPDGPHSGGPPPTTDPALDEVRRLRILKAESNPTEIGSEPVGLSFLLIGYSGLCCGDYVASHDYDSSRFRAEWTLYWGEETVAVGDEPFDFDATIDRPGRYRAQVDFFDEETGAKVHWSDASFIVNWHVEVSHAVEAGTNPGAQTVLEIPVYDGAWSGSGRLAVQAMVAYAGDAGEFWLEDPNGDRTLLWQYAPVATTSSSISWYPDREGLWHIEWVPKNPVVLGSDVTVDIQVDYY